MDDVVQINSILNPCYIHLTKTSCGYTWGVIDNFVYEKTKDVFVNLKNVLNEKTGCGLILEITKNDDICHYKFTHNQCRIMSFYKQRDKKYKHGYLTIYDQGAFDTIVETIISS